MKSSYAPAIAILISILVFTAPANGFGENQLNRSFLSQPKKCSTPSNLDISSITANSALVSWKSVGGADNFLLSYKLHSAKKWTTIPNITSTSYKLNGLSASTTYDIKVQAVCGGGSKSKATKVVSFITSGGTLHSTKNVMIILVDDSRQDSYTPDGGPSFFLDPNITRIATEGVHFPYCFPAESQCAPSRSSFYTGLYPHRTGVYNNMTIPDTITQTTLAEILHNNGYYCGMIGKYHLTSNPQQGYDYWMENHDPEYFNVKWNVNGRYRNITGHKTDIVTDSAIGFLKRVPSGKSFYLEVAFAAPHIPYEPRPQDDTLYTHDPMPLAPNPDPYTKNYPSFLYPCQLAAKNEDTAIRGYFRMLAGVEYSVGRLIAQLTAENILDSTLLIFTSDNGYLLGEHDLDAKRIIYEPSVKLPLYMRYPPAIPAGLEITNQMAMIFDLPPTILDYLGIANPVPMDGISLKKVIEGTEQRNEFFCEFFAETCTPDIRMVRSFDYKYAEYGCDSATAEFFDLTNDPEENTNQIKNHSYSSLISQYKNDLNNFEETYDYNTPGTVLNCYLASQPNLLKSDADDEDEPQFNLFPNPAGNIVELSFYAPDNTDYHLKILNSLGETIYAENGTGSILTKKINLVHYANGNYLLILQHGDRLFQKQFVVSR